MKTLKKQITDRIKTEIPCDHVSVLEYSDYVEKKVLQIFANGVCVSVEAEIWTEAINKALLEKKHVYIPDMNRTIYIDSSIIMRSDYSLKIAPEQVIALAPGTGLSLLRNENIIPGAKNAVSRINPDRNFSVEGGIWTALERENKNIDLRSERENPAQGAVAVMLISNAEDVVIKNVTFLEATAYAIEISNIEGFCISDITFKSFHRDGIHINGPSSYGMVRNLHGDDMGDDMVALNAWDWHCSAMTFGTIDHIYVSNIESTSNELRILPGQKIFDDGSRTECDIHHCVFENMSGIYTYKMYAQPFILNEICGLNDASGTVGNLYDLYFKNVEFPRIKEAGFGSIISVKGLFEICADCNNINIENVNVSEGMDELLQRDITLVKVGPLSATYKGGKDDPAKWGEVFDPNAVCTVDNLKIKNITYNRKPADISSREKIVRTIRLCVNKDYPNTTPRGGTGYGILKSVEIE